MGGVRYKYINIYKYTLYIINHIDKYDLYM